jgi:hypothetical protein
VCVKEEVCKLAENASVTVAGTSYTVSADSCMQLKPIEIPSISYVGTVITAGGFGSSCKLAKDCTSTDTNHGCLLVKKEKIS